MRIGSYNCRGLRLGCGAGDRARRRAVDNLLLNCDILCLQETFLPKQDLGLLNSFIDNFHGAGESTTDLSMGIVRGRIAGGVAVLWHKKLDTVISVIRLEVDWCIAVQFKSNNREFIVLNVYTPYECKDNEDDYLFKLAFINSFIQDNQCTCIYVVGDWNADISDCSSLFAKHLIQFCDDNVLTLSSQVLLPDDSYSYISEAWHTTSWLDHCVSTADAHATLRSMEIVYDASMSDHIPFILDIKLDSLPELTQEAHCSRAKLDWSKLTDEDILFYYGRTEALLNNVSLPHDAVLCTDFNCSDLTHRKALCAMYDAIVKILYEASSSYVTRTSRKSTGKPGWNKHVLEHFTAAKEAFSDWVQAGRPRYGPVLDHKKLAHARYKSAIRFVTRHEHTMRADSLAEKLLGCNVTGFWKEVKALNRGSALLPCTIEGVAGADNIAELWRQHYSALFNCIKNDPVIIGSIPAHEAVGVSVSEVLLAISQLADSKASGLDNITAEHLKHASPRVAVLLAICFTGLMSHGLLPDSMLSVTLVPVIKDKAGKVGSMDNYRPIALASILSKVLERILLDRLSSFFYHY